MGKPTICIGENKDADQLRGNREADQRLCFRTKTQISFAVTAKLISAFVFATRIVQFLFYLNPKFQASSYFLCLYRSVCVGPVRKFSHEAAPLLFLEYEFTDNQIAHCCSNGWHYRYIRAKRKCTHEV